MHEIEGIIVPAQKVKSQQQEGGIVYEGDFSQYMLNGDGNVYNVHFEITTKDGLKYITTDNPIATFYCHGISRNLDINYARLLPIVIR